MFKLTIITITRNNYDQLADTLRSCKELRKYDGVRQIVVDTSTGEIKKKNKILVSAINGVSYHDGDWEGIAKSYNYGINFVKEGWIWLLNASDSVYPRLDIQSFINILENTLSQLVIFSIVGKQSKTRWVHPPFPRRILPIGWIPQPGVILKKELYNEIGEFSVHYQIALDLDYWIRCFAFQTSVDIVSLPIAICDEEGISHSNYHLAAKESLFIIVKRTPQIIKIIFAPLSCIIKQQYIYLKQLLS